MSEEILGAFLLVNDYRVLSNEEIADLKISITNLLEENKELKEKQNYDLKWALKYDELYKENQELKKQLEENKTTYLFRLDSVVTAYKNQQKEFIKYLDNKRDKYAENLEYWSSELTSIILSKYKEIIGDKE